jgi:hypothetical protein
MHGPKATLCPDEQSAAISKATKKWSYLPFLIPGFHYHGFPQTEGKFLMSSNKW